MSFNNAAYCFVLLMSYQNTQGLRTFLFLPTMLLFTSPMKCLPFIPSLQQQENHNNSCYSCCPTEATKGCSVTKHLNSSSHS